MKVSVETYQHAVVVWARSRQIKTAMSHEKLRIVSQGVRQAYFKHLSTPHVSTNVVASALAHSGFIPLRVHCLSCGSARFTNVLHAHSSAQHV